MVASISNALAAYRNADAQGAAQGLGAEATPHSSFGDMVRDMVADGIEAGHKAERLSADGLLGQADLNEVVTAVNNAELSLHMAVGMRDKVIQAYQEIIRMPI